MKIQMLWGRTVCHFALFLALVSLGSPDDVFGQRRGGRGRGTPDDIGRPRDRDPNDPARKAAALAKKANEYFAAGQELMAKGKIGRAKSKFKAAIGMVGLEGIGQSALNALVEIHNQGMKQLGDAKGLYEAGSYIKAIDLAKETKVKYVGIFTGIEVTGYPIVSRLAERLIKKIENDPKAQAAIQEHEAKRRARRLDSLERRAERDKTLLFDIFKTCNSIAERYPNSPTGKRCAERAAELETDPKSWKIIRREKRRRYIASAVDEIDDLEKTGQRKEAAKKLSKLKKKYGDKSLDEFRRMSKKKSKR